MSTMQRQTSSLPQGFSVYQPALGAQLEFLPALGTPELDQLMNAYIRGSAPLQEKRTAITLDFLEYAQLTGQSFKFYAVFPTSPVAASSAVASPAQESVSSSFNASPMTPTWDWSHTPSVTSSRASTKARQAQRGSATLSRHSPSDFNHLPGMKILTRDGLDVTNSASRGSKTKEQRDHAHLMRVIKACDECKRRKTRCDPSHKRRTATASTPAGSSSSSLSQPARRTNVRASPPSYSSTTAPSPAVVAVAADASLFDVDAALSFLGTDDWDLFNGQGDVWDEFLQLPSEEMPNDFSSSTSPESYDSQNTVSTTSSSSASPFKSSTPISEDSRTGPDQWKARSDGLQAQPSLFGLDSMAEGYTDFNLYSPESTFSEDDMMLSMGSSTVRTVDSGAARVPNPPVPIPDWPPQVNEDVGQSVVSSVSGDSSTFFHGRMIQATGRLQTVAGHTAYHDDSLARDAMYDSPSSYAELSAQTSSDTRTHSVRNVDQSIRPLGESSHLAMTTAPSRTANHNSTPSEASSLRSSLVGMPSSSATGTNARLQTNHPGLSTRLTSGLVSHVPVEPITTSQEGATSLSPDIRENHADANGVSRNGTLERTSLNAAYEAGWRTANVVLQSYYATPASFKAASDSCIEDWLANPDKAHGLSESAEPRSSGVYHGDLGTAATPVTSPHMVDDQMTYSRIGARLGDGSRVETKCQTPALKPATSTVATLSSMVACLFLVYLATLGSLSLSMAMGLIALSSLRFSDLDKASSFDRSAANPSSSGGPARTLALRALTRNPLRSSRCTIRVGCPV